MIKYALTMILIMGMFSTSAWAAGKKRRPSSLVKTPKSMFLIKKAKITSDVGEPLFYPAETQLRTITNDQLLHDTKKFE